MNRKMVSLGALAVVCLGLGVARAQPPGTPDGGSLAPMPRAMTGSGPSPQFNATVPLTPAPARSLSPWIVGTEPDCCGPLGDHTPLKTELYLRSGISVPFGDGQMEKSLTTGWNIDGGWRALCFNDQGNLAWTFALGLLNIHNIDSDNAPPVQLFNVRVSIGQQRVTLPQVTARVDALNRTFVYFGSGLEYYLMGSAHGTRDGGDSTWRVGFDGGGRWGTAKVEFRDLRHLTDTIGGVYLAAHTDYEIPCGCCTYFTGLRLEWDYTWTDILQIQNKADLMGLNVMWSVGVRY
jgi:hypothetical protein